MRFRSGSLVPSAVLRSPNAFVSDAAPKTVRSPLSFEAAVVGGDDVDEDEEDFELLPHAVATSANVTTATKTRTWRDICDPLSSRNETSPGSSEERLQEAPDRERRLASPSHEHRIE